MHSTPSSPTHPPTHPLPPQAREDALQQLTAEHQVIRQRLLDEAYAARKCVGCVLCAYWAIHWTPGEGEGIKSAHPPRVVRWVHLPLAFHPLKHGPALRAPRLEAAPGLPPHTPFPSPSLAHTSSTAPQGGGRAGGGAHRGAVRAVRRGAARGATSGDGERLNQ